jgi:hypothetical protein
MSELGGWLRREADRWRDRGRHRPEPLPELPPEILARQVWVLIELGARFGPEVKSVEVMATRPPADFEEPRLQCWRAFINGGEAERWRPGPPWEEEERHGQ